MTLTLDTTAPTMTVGAAPTPALATPPAPVVTDRRRLELVETIDAQRAEIERLRADLSRAEYGQITDGGDSRLSTFWEKAMEIATDRDFCEQYDMIAEEMGGPRREKEFTVSLEVSATVTVYVNATGQDEEAAARSARDNLETYEVRDAVNAGNLSEFEVTEWSAEEV